eukprot:10517710-Alexandrium_andersonii.AAC.1
MLLGPQTPQGPACAPVVDVGARPVIPARADPARVPSKCHRSWPAPMHPALSARASLNGPRAPVARLNLLAGAPAHH